MTIILHSYTDVRIKDQVETKQAISRLSKQYTIISRKMEYRDSYWKFLLEHWGKDQIINIEQDIVPKSTMILSLLSCPYPACTYPYLMKNVPNSGWSLWRGVHPELYDPPLMLKPMVFYNKDGPINVDGLDWSRLTLYKPPFPVFAECSGFGLVKLDVEVQKQIPLVNYPIGKHTWTIMDSWISNYMQQKLEQPWHVHLPPVKHNHN